MNAEKDEEKQNPPAFQFYAQDFLTGIMYLTNEEIGIYIKMLAKLWTDGSIPKKRVGLLVGIEWENFSDELKEKFIDVDGTLINERLEKERVKKKAFIDKQRNNGSKGGRPKKIETQNNPKDKKTITQKKPLEEEIEIEVEEEIEVRRLTKKSQKKSKHLLADSPYYDYDEFEKAFLSSKDSEKYQLADLEYYHQAAVNWSAQGNKKIDWIATVRSFILSDKNKGKLQTINNRNSNRKISLNEMVFNIATKTVTGTPQTNETLNLLK